MCHVRLVLPKEWAIILNISECCLYYVCCVLSLVYVGKYGKTLYKFSLSYVLLQLHVLYALVLFLRIWVKSYCSTCTLHSTRYLSMYVKLRVTVADIITVRSYLYRTHRRLRYLRFKQRLCIISNLVYMP
jgi:hypothetical protein